MKLLAIEMSRITSLFRMTRPSGQPYLPYIVAQIGDRYSFSNAPHSFGEFSGNRVEFNHGVFEENAIETLEVYNDGIIVTSRSDTDFIDRFIDDFVTWLEEDQAHSVIDTHAIGKMYDSTLLIEMDRDIFEPLAPYSEVITMIEGALQETAGLDIKYHNYGFALSADQTRNPALKPAPFRLERKEGIDFSRHQFHATAPLKTQKHLEILKRLEEFF